MDLLDSLLTTTQLVYLLSSRQIAFTSRTRYGVRETWYLIFYTEGKNSNIQRLLYLTIRGDCLIVVPLFFEGLWQQLYYIWYHYSIIWLLLYFIEYPLSLVFDCIYGFEVVARGGLEPPTQGFSGIITQKTSPFYNLLLHIDNTLQPLYHNE